MDHTCKVTGKDGAEFVLFETGWCPLSTYFPSAFNLYGVRYRSVQHFYQSVKAKQFGDLKAYTMIMKATSPRTQAEIASTIENFDEKVWQKKAQEVMLRGLKLKFGQNVADREFLLGTGDSTIVFCSKHQSYWGNGLNIRDETTTDPSKWKGSNILGELLMKVRSELKMN
jgi:ribA/ribD-fused uncharacterized protein